MVPKGNPDRLPGARATEALRYSIADLEELEVDTWVSVHGGFNTNILTTVNPDYGMPLKSLRELQRRGLIKGIYPYFYTTVGNQTAVNASKDIGAEVAGDLKKAGVDAVIEVAG